MTLSQFPKIRPAQLPSLKGSRTALLQRKCTCGGSPGADGQCVECRQKQLMLQRRASGLNGPMMVPPAVHDILRSPGQPLDPETRAFMEPRFGHDFSQVRVHTDAKAAESARAVNALAYTVGRDIVFGYGQYSPGTNSGKHVLAHELTHVLQQGDEDTSQMQPEPQVKHVENGGYRIALFPETFDEPEHLERQADAAATQVVAGGTSSLPLAIGENIQQNKTRSRGIQRLRVSLPRPVPLCGRTLTHIDVEPPRSRPLEPCQPPTVLVTRMNIVGRDLSVPTPGRGPQVFNLHVGYFRDPTTGRWCGVIDDSKTCVAPRCLIACFPTLREVIDWILDALKKALIAIGIAILIILLILIGRGLLRPGPTPAPSPGFGPVPVIAAEGQLGGRRDMEAEA